MSSIFRHNSKVHIVKYYTAQVCIAQGFTVLWGYSQRGCDERSASNLIFRNCAKGQLISKANFEVFIWTKKRNFSISALAS